MKDSHKEDSKNKAAGKIFWPNYTGSLGSDKNNSESQSHSLKIECIERLWETFSMKTVDTFEDDVLIYVAPTPKTNDEIELNKQIKMWCYFHSRPFVEEMSFIKHTDCSSSTFELLKLSIKKDESNFMPFKINYRNDCNPSLISPKLEYNVCFMSSKTKNLSSFKLVDFDNQELITLENEKSLSRKLKDICKSKESDESDESDESNKSAETDETNETDESKKVLLTIIIILLEGIILWSEADIVSAQSASGSTALLTLFRLSLYPILAYLSRLAVFLVSPHAKYLATVLLQATNPAHKRTGSLFVSTYPTLKHLSEECVSRLALLRFRIRTHLKNGVFRGLRILRAFLDSVFCSAIHLLLPDFW